jgi:hypothetical protein
MPNDLSDGGEGLYLNETCGDDDIYLTVEQLLAIDSKGEFKRCDNCGTKTYDGIALDKAYGHVVMVNLPRGFTRANRRKYINARGRHLCLCTNCRYYVYGAY